MAKLNRQHMQVLCELFDTYAVKDQNKYYLRALERCSLAGGQANGIQASFAFLGGAASAGVALGTAFGGWSDVVTISLIVLAIVAPAISVAFSSLSDLYQWDRLVRIYEDSRESLIVADSYSPVDSLKTDVEYRGHLDAFVEASLRVMREETAQWGQLIQPPQQTEQFIERAIARVEESDVDINGDSESR